MSAQAQIQPSSGDARHPGYGSILLAVDSSDHSNRALTEAVALARLWQTSITAAHVYAAKLHDRRFRQMEGGLPERFQAEGELERQREVHDDLITRGLSIISDAYLDQVERQTAPLGLALRRRALEGKNYRELVREAESGDYDLLVLGSLGLGRVEGSRVGTVCRRVVRRSAIDTLVVKDPTRSIAEGPIVVALDGSPRAWGGLLTALDLAREWRVPVRAVAAFDPYYHSVAFNRIAGVLSEEAGQVFRFQEQEKLHEEIIDSGLARIYQGHLSVARSLAEERGCEIETVLLDGKPQEVIQRYLKKVRPSLLVLGRTGIHADPDLDIGGNAEHLLEDADCAVLLSTREHQPEIDRLAAVSTAWTREAEARMERVPAFVRSMARLGVLRYAQERGHTVITERLVEEATATLMPGQAARAMAEIVAAHDAGELKASGKDHRAPMRWSAEATARLLGVRDLALRGSLSLKAEKKARAAGATEVLGEHIAAFLDAAPTPPLGAPKGSGAEGHEGPGARGAEPPWQAAALARLARVPQGFMRDNARQRILAQAAQRGAAEITLAIAEAGLAEARAAMAARSEASTRDGASLCPFAKPEQAATPEPITDTAQPEVEWTEEARGMLGGVPLGFCRDLSIGAAESIARHQGVSRIDAAFIGRVLETIKNGSAAASASMDWSAEAQARLARVPDFVRGMLVREIEDWARRNGRTEIDHAAVDAVKGQWQQRGVFHLDPSDPRSG